jgi:threonine aldolase
LATPSEYTECVDSVSVCFSKGLGAPVGSALLGKKDFIAKARRVRKMFGGGMRQAGIVAAGALYAVKNHYSRLTEDHENAQEFAQKIADIPGVEVELETVQTNIVIFSLIENNAKDSVAALKRHDVLMNALGDSQVRAVTHLGVGRADILEAVDRIAAVLEA